MNTVAELQKTGIHVISVENPFDLSNRSISLIESSDMALQDVIARTGLANVVAAVNGEVVEADDWPQTRVIEGDYVVLCPVPEGGGGGKQVLRIVALVALSLAVPVVAGFAAGVVGAGTALGQVVGVLAGGLFVAAGSMLVNALLPIRNNLKGLSSDTTSSPSYGVDGAKTTQVEGTPIPVCYGTYRVGGNIVGIQVHNVEGDTQMLRMLIALSEGPIGGINTDSIQINNQPISAFKEVTTDVLLGLPRNPALKNGWFDESYVYTNIAAELGTSWTARQTSGPVDRIRIDLVCPSGFREITEQGESKAITREIEIEYKPIGSSTWLPMPAITEISHYDTKYTYHADIQGDPIEPYTTSTLVYGAIVDGDQIIINRRFRDREVDHWTRAEPIVVGRVEKTPVYRSGLFLSAMKTAAYRLSFETPVLPEQRYDVRVRRKEPKSTLDRIVDAIFWSDLVEIETSPVRYNNVAMLALSIQLSDQLSGIPNVTVEIDGIQTPMYETSETGEIFRLPVNIKTANPAWIALDMLTNTRYGGGMSTSWFDLRRWIEWADHCNALDLRFDGVFDTAMNLWDALQLVMRCGHAKLINSGTRISVAIERPEQPVMMFNVGNIIQASFQTFWLPMADRANEIEATYYDRDDDYKQKIVRVVDEVSQAVNGQRPLEVNLVGTTRYEDAAREAVLMLNLNRYILQTVSFDTSLEAIGCTIGDVVYVQHSMPQWSWGGRTEAAVSGTTVTLDSDVDLQPGKSYELLLHVPEVVKYTATTTENAPVGATYIRLDRSITGDLQETHVVIHGQDYRVASITRTGTDRRQINLTDPLRTPVTSGTLVEARQVDALITTPVTSGPGVHRSISIGVSRSAPQYTKWMLGETTNYKKKFRIMNIEGDDLERRTIKAMEYYDEVYTPSLDIAIPSMPSVATRVAHVTNLTAGMIRRLIGTTYKLVLHIAWERGNHNYSGADVFIRRGAGTWESIATLRAGETSFEYSDVSHAEIVEIKVVALDIAGQRAPYSTAPTVVILTEPSGVVLDGPDEFAITPQGGTIVLRWSNANKINYAKTEIWRATADDIAYASKIAEVSGVMYIDTDIVPYTEYWYWVRQVNTDGEAGSFNGPRQPSAPGAVTGLEEASPFIGLEANIRWNLQADAYAYDVEVVSGGMVRRTDRITSNRYTYSLAMARSDGYVNRAITFRVRAISVVGAFSPQQIVAVNNPAPALPASISMQPGWMTLSVNFSRPTEPDFEKVSVWMSETNNFTPGPGNLVAEVTGGPVMLSNLEDGSTYYVRLAVHDAWGAGPTSGQYIVNTLDASNLEGFSPWAFVTDADRDFINANLANGAIDSEKIVKLTASKIVTGTLAATEKVSVEGQIESLSGPFRVVLGPRLLDTKVALLSATNDGQTVFAAYEDGTASFRGHVNITGGIGFNALEDKPSSLGDLNENEGRILSAADFNRLTSGGGSLMYNGDLTLEGADGRPAGVKAGYTGTIDPASMAWMDAAKTALAVRSSVSAGAVFPAFRVNANAKYGLFIRVKASSTSTSGFYFRIAELDSELPMGATHVCANGGEAGVVIATRQRTGFKENTAIGDVWEDHYFEYTPSGTAKWASPYFLKWSGMGTRELHIDTCHVFPLADVTSQNTSANTNAVGGVSAIDVLNNINAALDAAAQAIDTADGKIETFYQDAEPTGGSVGDLWFKTNENRRLYRHNGTGWVVADDSRIATAITNASDAHALANTKVRTFFSTATPTGMSAGDLWYNTSTKLMKRYSGASWQDVATFGADWSATLSGIPSRFTDLPTPGLNLTASFMGYYEGGMWKTYIGADGKFRLYGNAGNYLYWDGTILTVRGDIMATNIAAGAQLQAPVITGGQIRTATSGARVEMNTAGRENRIAVWTASSTDPNIILGQGVSGGYSYDGVYVRTNGIPGTFVTDNSAGIAGQFIGMGTSARAIYAHGAQGSTFIAENDGSAISATNNSLSTSAKGLRFNVNRGIGIFGNAYNGIYQEVSGQYGMTSYGGSMYGIKSQVYGSANAMQAYSANGAALDVVSSNATGVHARGYNVGVTGIGNDAYIYSIGTMGIGRDIGVLGNGKGFDFYAQGTGGNYAPFTGSHEALIVKAGVPYEPGDIVSILRIAARSSVSNVFAEVELCGVELSRAAFGVIVDTFEMSPEAPIRPNGLVAIDDTEFEGYCATHYRAIINALGEGQINVCSAGGDIAVGDWISTSNMLGKGQKYDGLDMRLVVAKALEPVNWDEEPGTTKQIACVYLCG